MVRTLRRTAFIATCALSCLHIVCIARLKLTDCVERRAPQVQTRQKNVCARNGRTLVRTLKSSVAAPLTSNEVCCLTCILWSGMLQTCSVVHLERMEAIP